MFVYVRFIPDILGYFVSLIAKGIVDPFDDFLFSLIFFYLQYEQVQCNVLMMYTTYTTSV